MNINDGITELFCMVDDGLNDVPNHPRAILSFGELITLGFLFVAKGIGQREFVAWVKDNYSHLFPRVPERSRLFRRLGKHQDYTTRFLDDHTVMGIADSIGVELRHPVRDGRYEEQVGRKGISNHRWISGCKLCVVLNKFGLICSWECTTANVHDQNFQPLLAEYDGQMIVLADRGFHSARGDPDNVIICRRGEWNVRMKVETVFSMMSMKWGFKRRRHRTWKGFVTYVAYALAAFNILAQWNGLEPDEHGRVHLSIAHFTL